MNMKDFWENMGRQFYHFYGVIDVKFLSFFFCVTFNCLNLEVGPPMPRWRVRTQNCNMCCEYPLFVCSVFHLLLSPVNHLSISSLHFTLFESRDIYFHIGASLFFCLYHTLSNRLFPLISYFQWAGSLLLILHN